MSSAEAKKALSPFQLRMKRFRRLKRGYYSFLFLTSCYVLSFFLPFLMNSRALIVKHEGNYYFPSAKTYLYETIGVGKKSIHKAELFGQTEDHKGRPVSNSSETDYRALKAAFQEADNGNWVLMPPISYDYREEFLDVPLDVQEKVKSGELGRKELSPPFGPSELHWFGTDDSGRDLMVRLAYGFRISISFALVVVVFSYMVGIITGAILGYYGGWMDIIGQRFVEIWGAIPFLYSVIILAAIFQPSFALLAGILASFGWMSISYYIRGEFYREKAKDYVAAAIATGESNTVIMLKHILPNALTPVITFAPFAIVAAIVSLVSLDFLGFGLQPPTPSWGEMLRQAKQNLKEWHLVVFPLGAMFLTLQLIVFIGEAVREAFDPKVFSRLR